MIEWSHDQLTVLREGVVAGLSFAQIARKIGMGCSRSAAIGKAYRMGYSVPARASAPRRLPPLRSAPASPPGKAATITPPAKPALKLAGRGTVFEEAETQAPRAELRPEAFAPLPGIQPIPFIDRNWSHCAWPVGGEGAEMLCCGAQRDGEGPYCGAHRRSATQAVRPGSSRNGQELARSLRRFA